MLTRELVFPLCVYAFFLLALVLLLGAVRVFGRFRGVISKEYLRAAVGSPPPARIIDLHHHFSNQFEMPVLFFFGCILSLVIGAATEHTVKLAWIFVALRLIHTAIVLVSNRPGIRVFPFVFSTVVVGLIWGEVLSHVTRSPP